MPALFGISTPSKPRTRAGVSSTFFLLLTALFLFSRPVRAAQKSTYVFLTDKSTITQTGGIAGIHRIYTITGTFILMVDFDTGTASFDRVDANAVDDSPYMFTLDPNEVFNMTALTSVVIDPNSIRFEGEAADGSSILITLTFVGDTVALKGQTTPPQQRGLLHLYPGRCRTAQIFRWNRRAERSISDCDSH